MATGTAVNQGKSAFLEKFLGSNGDAKMETVNKAWNAAGNEGTISPGLLKKLRSKVGLTNKRTAKAETSGKAAGPRTKSKPAKRVTTKQASKPERVHLQPKNSEGDTGPSKTAFVEEMLGRKPKANVKAVNEEWRTAGNQDKISDSIYYKVKRELGGSGMNTSSSSKKPKPGSASRTPAARAAARTTGEARPESSGETNVSSSVSRSESRERERVLDRVEDGIDDLIIELKELGGMEEVLEALRKVRRVVVRSHQG